ncbi:oxidoreductase HTATIP2 isoform X2 [Aplysia californica]|uniref:Protein HTATIP2 n=1 Tax=Aplysia californica TaxID=6500 RepID=A0ABM1A0Y1_APLCA|nr:oxidoreductase HTATIP2 isoform X2 [Aplysia californica]
MILKRSLYVLQRMTDEALSSLERFKSENHTAFVLGYSGEVGKALVEELNQLKVFKRVVLIGRRQVPLSVGPEFEQRVVDFENLDDHKDAFKDLDMGFCCLGTTRGKSGVPGFIRVDHDYVLLSAEIAKAHSCKHFSLVSSQGANKNSSFLYPRTKGQVEEALKVMHFDRLSIYRPGLLMVDRQESRPMEATLRTLLRPVSYFFPTAVTTPVKVMALAMINNGMVAGDKVEVYDNKAIHQLSGISKGCPMKRSASAPESTKTK